MCIGCLLDLTLVYDYIYRWIMYDNFIPEIEELQNIWATKIMMIPPEPSTPPPQLRIDDVPGTATIRRIVSPGVETNPEPLHDFEIIDFNSEKMD